MRACGLQFISNGRSEMLDNVLCVDDDAITLMLCKATITKAMFSKEVTTAINGQEAIDYFKSKDAPPIDLVLLDLNMPVKNGWDFLDEFVALEKKPAAKVAILSSSMDPGDVEKAKAYAPVITFLHKPLTFDSLEDLKKDGAFRSRFR